MKPDIEKLKEFMRTNFGVTPENIDEKLEELRVKLRDTKQLVEGWNGRLGNLKK